MQARHAVSLPLHMNQENNHHPVHPTPLHRGRGWGWVHFFHNLKIAFRNLLKYKFQTLVSVSALAVGMVTLAATHFVLKHMGPPSISKEEYYDRCYVAYFPCNSYRIPVENDTSAQEFIYLPVEKVSPEMHDALFSGGPLPGVERVIRNAFMGGITMGSSMTFNLADGTQRAGAHYYYIKQAEDLNFWGIRSAITGEKIPVLNDKEAVICHTLAQTIFDKDNPIGCTVGLTHNGEWKEFTIRDVYSTDCIADGVETGIYVHADGMTDDYLRNYCLVLQEGQDPKEVEAELTRRLKHFDGISARLTPLSVNNAEKTRSLLITRTIVYLISSLILAAALIGFLKMQLQLFRMRQREVALRRVHGATSRSIFRLFACETILTFVLAGIVAFILAILLIDFANTSLTPYINDSGWHIDGVYESVAVILGATLLLSLVVVWFTVRTMMRQRQSMAMQLHRSRGHALRNTMLGIQIAICILFVGGSLALTHFSELALKGFNVPENDDFYKKCIMVRPYDIEDSPKIMEYLHTEAKDIECFIPIRNSYFRIKEILEDPKAKEELGYLWIRQYNVSDSTLLNFWNRSIRWILPPKERTDCLLLSDSLYAKMEHYGLTASGVLQPEEGLPYRIGGTFATLPYMDNNRLSNTCQVMYIRNWSQESVSEIIVQPKKGAYERVFANLKDEMHRINPKPLDPRVVNLRETLDPEIRLFELMQRASWILSGVCLVICLMGIWSTIALDTRSRQKEVALRKIHGAKRKDIALLFGRLYLWLIGIATLVSAPLIILFNTLLKDWANSGMASSIAEQLSPILPILASLALTVLIIALIVGHHIQQVIKQHPADIIAKE